MLLKLNLILLRLTNILINLQPTTAASESSVTRTTITLYPREEPPAPEPTLVWNTGYDQNGNLVTTQSPFTQTQFRPSQTLQVPPAGTVGLAFDATGIIGTVREYEWRAIPASKPSKTG